MLTFVKSPSLEFPDILQKRELNVIETASSFVYGRSRTPRLWPCDALEAHACGSKGYPAHILGPIS